jgi:hypothetical protein
MQVFVAEFEALFLHFPRGTGKNHKKISGAGLWTNI